MKILNYETFLETMQFAVLKNAQNLTNQEEEEERRKSKQQKEDNPTFSKKPVDDISGEEMEAEVEEPEMEGEREEPEMEGDSEEPEI